MAPEVINKTYLKMTEEQLKESDIWSFRMHSNIFFFLTVPAILRFLT